MLVLGPTGVGKDVLSEDIHRHSARAGGPFIAVNCAAISPALFESELFGHARGAYTSAVAPKPGLVELADRGTLFLDEVGELPLEAQVKLLRFLAKGTFWPVGGSAERTADVRVISATHRDLPAQIGKTFREDLYYRLSVVTIHVPPLDADDTRALARRFAEALGKAHGRPLGARDLDAVAALAAEAPWRGGARELHNAVERLFLLGDPSLSVEENWRALAPLAAPHRTAAPSAPPDPPAPIPDPGRSCTEADPPRGRLAAPDTSLAMQHMDDLVFLSLAQQSRDVRELSARTGRSLQTVYERLKRLGIKPRDVGDTRVVARAIGAERKALTPFVPWIQDLLTSFPET